MDAQTGPQAPHGTTRRKVLNTLKKSDGMTADQLAEVLGITAMAVRKHLAALQRDGLVESSLRRHAVGRPANVYRSSDLADDFFPKHYDLVATELLSDLIQIDGPEKVNTLLSRRADRMREFLEQQLGSARTLAERVAALAQSMDELGYLATWEQVDDSTYLLKQYNCTINRIAACFPMACQCEADIFRQLLDADVERGCHIFAGDHHCSYIIKERASQ